MRTMSFKGFLVLHFFDSSTLLPPLAGGGPGYACYAAPYEAALCSIIAMISLFLDRRARPSAVIPHMLCGAMGFAPALRRSSTQSLFANWAARMSGVSKPALCAST